MDKEKLGCCMDKKIVVNGCNHSQGGGALYGLGVIGSLFYFLQGINGFVPVLTGVGKAFFWPAFVVYEVLGMLGV